MRALAIALSRSVKTDTFIHVQEQIGECTGYLQLIEGAIILAEQKADDSGHGTLRPALEPLQALRYHIPKFYERMVRLTQVLGAGGILSNPTYTGTICANRTRVRAAWVRRSATHPIGQPRNSQVPLPPEEWIAVATVPAIVTREQFDWVQARIAANRSFARQNNTVTDYLLRALLTCGSCRSACRDWNRPAAASPRRRRR